MCMSVPGKITSLDQDTASVDINGIIYQAGTHLIENPQIGDYVLVHAGYIIQKIDENEALATLSVFRELEKINESRI
ncbi:MAG: hydrogenase assembly protein HypC [Spirochaetes bacterium GWF1_41_5]|nr:MAG: hydrogenase assembly protein HypC [Spirochaetes bacterium GWF1_41_5]